MVFRRAWLPVVVGRDSATGHQSNGVWFAFHTLNIGDHVLETPSQTQAEYGGQQENRTMRFHGLVD